MSLCLVKLVAFVSFLFDWLHLFCLFVFIYIYLAQGLTTKYRLSLDSQTSCLNFHGLGITVVYHYILVYIHFIFVKNYS